MTRNVTLTAAATISGTLSRADGTTPHNISALLDGDPIRSDPNGEGGLDRYDPATRVHVHTNGTYEFVGVPAGKHNVSFTDDSGKYVDQCYDNVVAKYDEYNDAGCGATPEATEVTAVGGQKVTLDPQTMSHPGARISGTVTDTSGNPIKGMQIRLTPVGGTGNHYATTHTSGAFSITALPAGQWLMSTSDPNVEWAGEWYDNAVKSDATVLNLTEGQVKDNLAVDLKARAALSARVTTGPGSASFAISVTRKTNGGPAYGTVTVAYGTHSKSATLSKGTATIKLTGIPSGSTKFTVSYAGTSSTAAATKTYTTTVAAGAGVKGVVSSQGNPVPGLKVELMQSGDDGDSYDPIESTTSDSAGAYSFADMPTSDAWSYKVRVSDPHGTVVTTVRAFQPVPKKSVTRNVTVQPAGSLAGKVLRADGASPTTTRVHLIGPDVQIGNPDDFDLAYDDDRGVHEDGSYDFVGLPAGDYTVRYTDTSGSYLDQCYDDVLAALSTEPTCDKEEAPAAKTVTVVAKQTSTLDDQQLHHAGARISGVVTDTSGAPLKNIHVIPHPVGTDDLNWYDYEKLTSSAGVFARGPLPAGQWQLSTEDSRNVWAAQWVGGTSQATATVFDLAAGDTVGDIAIKLRSRASIKSIATAGTGSATFAITVSRLATGAKVSAGQVTALVGDISKSAQLANGSATIKLTGVPAGKHTFTVRYAGSDDTANGARTYTVTVK